METNALTVPGTHDTTIVALTPAEMPAAQTALLEWTDRQVALLGEEVTDLEEHRAIAKANGWKLSAVERRLSMAKRRQVYYGKLREAVAAGYLLVPNMPVDVFAVRVRQVTPPQQMQQDGWRPTFHAQPELLPAGHGRYVGDKLTQHRDSWEAKDSTSGALVPHHLWVSDGFEAVDFPMKVVKPMVLEATARALALKVFDQLGIVRDNGVHKQWRRRGDPIVVGQLIDPRGQGRGVTFYVAWWLDTATL